ncbi:hypothetical protein HBE96_08895 [Clostridium sp. P21]|uniref:Uncharacterized protein n=1 Tax=Clostridium muellerianum TaxID=2716538 RepID=A0A7Y0EG59_9CLOT|nr:hypothetical protein [Clostridium muellerianum]NMM62813.1 hypothetical protein [Clostridium muellerianum]
MCIVKFKNKSIQLEVKTGTKLIDCIREAGLIIEKPCNLTGKWGKCKVKAYGELYPKTEEEILEEITKNTGETFPEAHIKGGLMVTFLKALKYGAFLLNS